MHFLLIANPVSGGDSRPEIDRAVAWLRARGAGVEVRLTGAPGDARRFAAEARAGGCDRIIAAGGDGTLNEVVNGLVPSPIPVAFLPLGTTNVLALEIGLRGGFEQACQVALTGIARPVCLGRAGDERFLLMASAGFDATAVHRVDLALKKRVGKRAYVASALQTLRSGPLPVFRVVGDDGTMRAACQVVAGNGRYYGGRFRLTPAASLFAPQLHICLIAPMSRPRFVLTALALLAGVALPGVTRFAAGRLHLLGEGLPLQLDGDDRGTLPCEVSAGSGELLLVFPEERK